MTAIERESILKLLAEKRARLQQSVEGLTAEQMSFRSGPDRWSAADCIEHIVVVEQRVLAGIERALSKPAEPERAAAAAGKEERILQASQDRGTPREAPEPVRPTGRWPDHAELLRELSAAHQRLHAFVATTEADLRRHVFPHMAFHDLDCYQWLVFIAAHDGRHAAQVEEIRADPAFPPAAERAAGYTHS